MGSIHVVLLEIVDEFRPKTIVSLRRPNHGNGCTLPCGGNCLIGPFTAWDDLQITSADRLAGLWKTWYPHDEISIERANIENISHTPILLDLKFSIGFGI